MSKKLRLVGGRGLVQYVGYTWSGVYEQSTIQWQLFSGFKCSLCTCWLIHLQGRLLIKMQLAISANGKCVSRLWNIWIDFTQFVFAKVGSWYQFHLVAISMATHVFIVWEELKFVFNQNLMYAFTTFPAGFRLWWMKVALSFTSPIPVKRVQP